MNTYINYDLRITLRGGEYHLRADCSLAGTANGQCTAPFSDEEIDLLCWQDAAHESDPKEIGQRLYDAIFQDKIGMHLRECLATAAAQNNRLRIRLHLSKSPQLARLPWEYLYDVARDNFFALSIQTPIVRYLEMSSAELAMKVGRTIHILVMISDPLDIQPRLDVDKEWYQLQAAFQDLEDDQRIKLHRLPNATKLQLQRYLRKNEIDIFHFIGHGRFDQQREEGLLAFESDRGQAEYVSADVLARLLKDNMPRLVYLNSCETAQTGVHDPLTGTAQELVQQGVPAVVAMQTSIQDDKAIQIAHEFYLSLTDGYPVDAALAEGRKAVFSSNGPAEWGTPVLFMRSPDGILWDNEYIGDDPEIVVVQPPVPEIHGKPTPNKRKGLPMIAWLLGAVALLAILWFSFGFFPQGPKNPPVTPIVNPIILTETPTPLIPTETHTPIPPIATDTPTNRATPTAIVTAIVTATSTDRPTSTSTATGTSSATVTPSSTIVPTSTPTATAVDTAIATSTNTATSTPTATSIDTATATATATSTATPTATALPTFTATSTTALKPVQGSAKPGDVAREFYSAIDAGVASGNFEKAYGYLSARRQARRSYDDFAAGFVTTAGVEVESIEQLQVAGQSAEMKIVILAIDTIGEAVQKIRYDIIYQLILENSEWKMDTASVTELYGEAIVDGIVYVHVPAGKFIMGSTDETIEFALGLCQSYYHTPENCELSWYEDEQPQHSVDLASYWIMQTEVTNAQYARFIEAGGYDKQEYWSATGWSWRNENGITEPGTSTQNSNLNGPNQPIIDISLYEAEAYTNWLSAKTKLSFGLPTEAEWEKAARGTEDRLYPWGDSWDGSRFNYCDENCTADHADKAGNDGYRYSAPVGSYPTGASPYGALDMAGNVWEWTTDFYDGDYYASSPENNPTGPESGELFVVRGGAWSKNPNIARTAYRGRIKKALRTNDVGFRVRLSSLD